MIHENIEIKLDYGRLGINHNGAPAVMTTYIKDMYPQQQNSFRRPMVIICPGGGYHHHSPREGEAIALKMLDFGYNAAVLRYSLMPDTFPCALYEAAYAVAYARKQAEAWDIDPDRIIAAGFSAGGHVAASLGTMWHDKELEKLLEVLGEQPEAVRPNGLLLGYPVITSGQFAHRLSFERLLGDRHAELAEQVSLEKRVTQNTPAAFIWHTAADQSVPVENSFLFAQALKQAGVPFELHIFPEGSHGLGLGTKETDTKDGTHFQPEVYAWTELFKTWMENLNE